MGAGASKAEKIYKAAKGNDTSLKELLRSCTRDELSGGILENADSDGFTPLCVASIRGNHRSVAALLQYGADVHHLTHKPQCSTPLHEACAYNHAGVATLLLEAGANPFVENGRGLTAVDIAINNGNIHLLRRLEQQCPFAAYLAVKVPRYMGFGAEWKPRWCVVMPRMPNPVAGPPREQQVARLLLVMYKAADSHQPSCKAWLDGAVARSVVGSRGSNQAQCALALHRSHAAPAYVHLTGDPSVGFSLHLRPADNRADNLARFRAFMDIVNHVQPGGGGHPQHQRTSSAPSGTAGSAPGTPVAPFTPQGPRGPRGPLAAGAPSNLGPSQQAGPSTPYSAAVSKEQALGPPIADTGLTDEELAQRLQQDYDHEVSQYLAENPQDADMHRLAEQFRGGSTSRVQQPPGGGAQPSGAGPGAGGQPMYPAIPHSDYAQWASAPQQQQGQGHAGAQHSPSHSDPGVAWEGNSPVGHSATAPPLPVPGSAPPGSQDRGFQWWTALPAAPAPPESATGEGSLDVNHAAASLPGVLAGQPAADSKAASAQSSRTSSADEDGKCVVCLSNPCTAGFVHGDSVHKCCCRECALDLKQSGVLTCPMCHATYQTILFHFY